MSGFQTQQVGWVQLPGPTVKIDISKGVNAPNLRSDPLGIAIWDRTAAHWQYWQPEAGWSALYPFPSGFSGPVGPLAFDSSGAISGFNSAEYYPSGPSTGSAFKVRQINLGGNVAGADTDWPAKVFWPSAYEGVTALQNFEFGDPLAEVFASQDSYDPAIINYYTSLVDPFHLYVPMSAGFNDQINSVLLAFNPLTGNPDYGQFIDIDLQIYIQNMGRNVFLYQGPFQFHFHPTGGNVWGQVAYPFISEFQGAVIGMRDFQFSRLGDTGPIFTNARADTLAPLGPLAEVRTPGPTNISTRYFPSLGAVEGYGWVGVLDLSAVQAQMFAATHVDSITSPYSGIMGGAATVSPFRFEGAGPPNAIGIIYIPYGYGWQGPPIGVLWPENAVAPWYGMIWDNGVYLIDSHNPPQMFALIYLTANFAALYPCANWVRMGDE